MQLTLRTLLAYLDDTLEPAAAKEIGQKLTESPVGQELVSRIKEVTRRRRVTAPAVVGDDVDPNVVSEYLNDLLPPDAVRELEQHCLESDVHLAEVAACHQILTLIGHPAGVSNATRARMYELVHAIESIPPEKRVLVKPAPQRIQPPSMFTQRPMLARVLTGAAIVLGAVFISWLVWVSLPPGKAPNQAGPLASVEQDGKADGHFIPSRRAKEDNELESTPSVLETNPVPVDVINETPAPEPLPVRDGRNADVTETSEPMPDAALPGSTPPEPIPPKPVSETASDTTKPADAMPKPESEPPTPPTPMPEKPEEKPVPVLGSYAATSGVMVHWDESNRDWRRLAFRSDVHESERLLCLPTYRAMLQLPTGATAELVGETEVSIQEPDEGIDAHIRLDRGRIVLGTSRPQAVFQIDFLNQTWRITLKAPENSVGLSLAPIWRPGGPFTYDAALIVPRGEVELNTGTQAQQLGGPVQLRWNSVAGMREKESLSVPAPWLEREELSPSEVRASAALEEDLKADAPVGLSLIDATTNDRKESRLLGVVCLGAIGRLPALIDAMNTMGRREVRQAAIAVLRRYIAAGPDNENALRQALFVKFSKSEVHTQGVIDLLRGYSDAEFQQLQKKNYEDLVKLLATDSELLIRELAIMNLEDLAGKPLNTAYNPDKPKDSDIAAWQRALTDGRLPPKVRGKM